jgi:hypothetical protein
MTQFNNFEIETFKYQLCEESLGLFNDDNPATYSIILKHFRDVLDVEQIQMLEDKMTMAKNKNNYINKRNLFSMIGNGLKPAEQNKSENNYVIKHE